MDVAYVQNFTPNQTSNIWRQRNKRTSFFESYDIVPSAIATKNLQAITGALISSRAEGTVYKIRSKA